MNRQRQLVFIVSLPRSGSTLLGHMMGALPSVMYTGEVPAPLLKGRPVRCRSCQTSSCPVWNDAVSADFVHRCFAEYQQAGRSRFRRQLASTIRQQWGRGPRPAALFTRLFDRLPHVGTIVDSSKHHSWIRWNGQSTTIRHRYVVLIRDLRGVTASICRSTDGTVSHVAARIARSMRKQQRFVSQIPEDDVLHLRYEQLIKDPQSVGLRLCQFINVPFSQRFLQFANYPSHVFGGNSGPVSQCLDHSSASQPASLLQLDQRWMKEFSARDKAQFDQAAGAVNQKIGYA